MKYPPLQQCFPGFVYSLKLPSEHLLDIGVFFYTYANIYEGKMYWAIKKWSDHTYKYGGYFDVGLTTRYYFSHTAFTGFFIQFFILVCNEDGNGNKVLR